MVLIPRGQGTSEGLFLRSAGTFTQVSIGALPKSHWNATVPELPGIVPMFLSTIRVPLSGIAAADIEFWVTGPEPFVMF
jgi:hypothetical protein